MKNAYSKHVLEFPNAAPPCANYKLTANWLATQILVGKVGTVVEDFNCLVGTVAKPEVIWFNSQ